MPNNWLKKYTMETKQGKREMKKKRERPPKDASQRKRHASANPFLPLANSDSVSSVQSRDGKPEPSTATAANFLCTSLRDNNTDDVLNTLLRKTTWWSSVMVVRNIFCNICIEMTADEYQVLQRPDCIWRCPDCATKVATNSTAKEWMKEILKDIDTKFTMLEILLQHRNTEIDQNLDKKLGEFEKKIEEKWTISPITSQRKCQTESTWHGPNCQEQNQKIMRK